MFKNYFTIAWRNLVRNKGYSIINISGLAAGMAVAMLILLWVYDELSFNHSFKNYDRLAQVYHRVTFGDQNMTINDVPAPMGEALKNAYAEFEEVTIASWPRPHVLALDEKKMSESGLFVEPQFADMFSIRMVEGSAAGLKDVRSMLLSKTLAASLFGENAVGKTLMFDNRDPLMVSGVFEDFPANSEFATIKFLVPMAYRAAASEQNRKQMSNWEDYSFQCFVLLRQNASVATLDPKIKNVLYDHASNDGKSLKPEGLLLPMERWHLYAGFVSGMDTGGNIRFVWMFGTIGIFVLLLACINFMNLSTAQSEKRAKEVGVRKVMGSLRKQLVLQFLSESWLIVAVGFVLALIIVVLSLPWFNGLAGKSMVLPWKNFGFATACLVFIFLTSMLAGSYPAFYLSSFKPVSVLKGAFKAGRFAALPRKAMVIFQFTTSIVLIIGTLVVLQQINHAKERPLGFDREGIFHVALRTDALTKADYNTLRSELLATGVVNNMATSDFPITGAMSGNASITWEGKDPAERPLITMNSCSHDFPSTNGFQFVQGRDFSRERASDSLGVIINEMAAKLISGNVIGRKMNFGYGREREIIGVIKDQVRWTPYMKQTPHIYYIDYAFKTYVTVRLHPQTQVRDALKKVEAVIQKFDGAAPFEYKFLDDDYAHMFVAEERIGTLAGIFATLAIFISCIGIFGLAAFAASQRTKEIGIRKVLGASVLNVWAMLSGDFVRLVLLSVLLGMPVAYYFANQWLQQYDYRVEMSWLIFAGAGLLALVVTLLTVSYQTFKAALTNPVKCIRTE
ncbi:ABC transporter permease [Chryseolinea lacunae]|uniref:ABC transporter permease n=1 Tax=Chryseolinea lacunae TaxID=2801331 RepID=A0ABS1KNF0_9BACT|nr:ABC transporter permease [Chryseolinea lacunae]MBL0740956.1 ABC transporter permease [Chryseolinea lacunae]